jgi:hypothetical protein
MDPHDALALRQIKAIRHTDATIRRNPPLPGPLVRTWAEKR